MQSEDATNITNVYKERTKVAVAMVGISTDDYMVRILSDECFEVTPGYKTEIVIYTDINMVDILSNNCYLVDPGYRTEKYMTTITHTVQSQNNPFILILLGVLSVIAFSYLHLKPNISPKKLIEKVVKKIDNDDFVELKEIMKKIESDDFVKLMESMKIDVSDLREAVGELDLSKREVTEIEKLLKKMKSLENLPHFENLAIHNMQSALQNSTIDVQILSNAVKECEVFKVDQEIRHYKKGNIILKILQSVENDSTGSAVEAKSYWARISDFFSPQKDAIRNMQSALQEENIDVQILSNAVKECEVHKVDQENRHYEKGNIILKILQLAGNDFVYNDSTSVAAVDVKSYWARFSDFFTGETLQKIDCPQKDAIEKMWSALREENVEEFTAAVKGFEDNNFDKNKYYKMGKIILEILRPPNGVENVPAKWKNRYKKSVLQARKFKDEKEKKLKSAFPSKELADLLENLRK